MAIDLLADEPIDLFATQPKSQSFEELSPEDQKKALSLSKQKITEFYSNMPEWLQEFILKHAPKNENPTLNSAARGVSDVTNYIPAIAGGALQGASIPIRGIASMIPNEYTQQFANSPDLRELFPKAQGLGQETAQLGGELVGGGGLFGKMLQGVKGATAFAGIPKAMQAPVSLGATGYLATPGTPMDKSQGAGAALLLGGAGDLTGKVAGKIGEKAPAFMRGLFSKSTPEELVQAVQKPHDVLQNTADELYGQVRQAIKKRGIKPKVNEKYLDEIMKYPSMRSNTHKELIQKAKEGDYEALHKLQSSLYKKASKDMLNDDSVIETRGENLMDLREKINDDLERDLIKEGHIDVAHVLKQGKKTVANLKSTYFDKLLPKGIGKMVHRNTRLIPENPENLFTQNSVPMKEFLAKHPDAAKHVQGLNEKHKAMEDLKKIFLSTGLTGGTLSGGKMLYELFK